MCLFLKTNTFDCTLMEKDLSSIKRRHNSFITNYQSRAPERVLLSKHSHFHNKQRKRATLHSIHNRYVYVSKYLDRTVLYWYLRKQLRHKFLDFEL